MRSRRLLPWFFALAIAANLFELASLTVLGWNGQVPSPVAAPIGWDQIVRLAGVFWVLLFASLIWTKGAKTRENTLLVLILVLLALQSPFDRTVLPNVRGLYAYRMAGDLTDLFLYGLLLRYSMLFGTISRARRALFAVSLSVIAVEIIALELRYGQVFAPALVPYGPAFNWQRTVMTPMLLFPLLSIAAAIPSARADERPRLGWIVAAFVPFLIGWTLGNVTYGNAFWFAVQNVSFFFIPAGLTYAALSRKLFDVGFVLNRAAVFTCVSAVVVGAFVLLEWALGQWFVGLSHASSLAINGGLALVIGVSFRLIHRYVDRAVDTIFFRRRQENEAALRRFAREAAFFTGDDALVERTVATILAHSDASNAGIVFAKDLNANDPAVVAMKAWQEPLDLSTRATSIEGDVAFPMLAHGSLVGAIVLGAKTTGEHFAPDEMETLQTVAHGVGLALDGMRRNLPEDGRAIARGTSTQLAGAKH